MTAPNRFSVCVFCGSKIGHDPEFSTAAAVLGTDLARHGIRLVYGGGNIGVMGVVADAALAAGGQVIGVIPAALLARELGHAGITDLQVVDTMHTRKARMADQSDAFVALPGGLGTFEELFEILTWGQLRLHSKPVCILNVKGYYDSLLTFLDQTVAAGFVSPQHRELLHVFESAPAVVDWMAAHAAKTATSVQDDIR